MLANGKEVNYLMLNGEVFAKTYDDIIGKKISVPNGAMVLTNNGYYTQRCFDWNLKNQRTDIINNTAFCTDNALKKTAVNTETVVKDWFLAKTSRNHKNQDSDTVIDIYCLWYMALINISDSNIKTAYCWVRAKDVKIIES